MSETPRFVEVPEIGRFEFKSRTMRDEFRIGAEYSRLTEGVAAPTPWLSMLAQATATLKVLVTSAPDGWDLDKMDPLDEVTYQRILAVHKALREREEFFRSGGGPKRETASPSK